jgi:hypothetical protein
MAAPDYVPKPVDELTRTYSSPPRRNDSWLADRPAELQGRQPTGARLGSPGPDQGYALHLARRYEGRLALGTSESEVDAIAGCLAIAMRRSSLFGRAPILGDLTLALTFWGFLVPADDELIAIRSRIFAAVASSHHYVERRAIVDAVSDDVLRMTIEQVADVVRTTPAMVLATAEAVEASTHGDGH